MNKILSFKGTMSRPKGYNSAQRNIALECLGKSAGWRVPGKHLVIKGGNFEVKKTLGQGGYGKTYCVEHKGTGNIYTLKILDRLHAAKAFSVMLELEAFRRLASFCARTPRADQPRASVLGAAQEESSGP